MTFTAPYTPEIWSPKSEIWPDFPKSEILMKSEIWIFLFLINDLMGQIQISGAPIRNLNRNLDLPNEIMDFCQISDFRKSTPKGVGGPPLSAGEPPPTPGQISRTKVWFGKTHPTTAAGTAKHQPPSSFSPSSQPEKETTHG